MASRHLFALAAALALSAPSLGPAAAARAKPYARHLAGPIAVDVSRLRALGLGPTADIVASVVADELAGAALPNGRVVVRVTALSMNAYAGTEGGGGGGAGGGDGGGGGGGVGENDYMEGDILVLGPGGEILTRRPIVMSLPANSGGAYYLPGSEERRVVAISRNFARWVKRDLG